MGAHLIIRVTAGFAEYSHAIIVSHVSDQLMVLEAVSNVDTGNEPSGVREVAIEYAFHKVTKFAAMRKGHWLPDSNGVLSIWHPKECGLAGSGRANGGIEWGRLKKLQEYDTPASFVSIGWTPEREEGWNENDQNMPTSWYCSQYVAWILYKQGCAYHSGKNLNVDPWEMIKYLSWTNDYSFITCSGSHTTAHSICDTNFGSAMDDTRENKRMIEHLRKGEVASYAQAVCDNGGKKSPLDCQTVEVLSHDPNTGVCSWRDGDCQLTGPVTLDTEEHLATGGELASMLYKLEEDIHLLEQAEM